MKRPCSFSLRTLFVASSLIAMAVFSLTYGWAKQSRIVSMLTAKDATLTYGQPRHDGNGWDWSGQFRMEGGYWQQTLSKLTGNYPKLVGFFQDQNSSLTEDEILSVLSLPNLQRIDLSGAKIDDRVFRALVRFDEIHELYLANTNLTNDQLSQLLGHGNIRYIEIANTAVTTEGLTRIAAQSDCSEIYLRTPEGGKSLREIIDRGLSICED